MQWSVPKHDETLVELTAALAAADRTGAVVTGPDGSGKSTLARDAVEQYLAARPDAVLRQITGTATERTVPFGACSHLVQVSELGKPVALLRAARESLRAGAEDLLVVDDAHQLDPLTATLVYQLARAGGTRMLVTARADAASAQIRALWDDALLTLFDIGSHCPPTDPDTIAAFVDDLPDAVRAVLDVLAVQEPIALTDLRQLTGAAAVHQAEALGVVEVLDRDGQSMVFTAHPSFAERARAIADPEQMRRLRSRLLPLLTARCGAHPSDRLRAAALAVDSATPPAAQQAVTGAREALRLGDLELAERLGRAALRAADTLDARLVLAQALAWQDRGREAGEVLAAVDPAGLTEAELMSWALPRAANQFWMLGEPEHATTFLRNVRAQVSAPGARQTLDALSATFAMNAGNLSRSVELATGVLAAGDADDTAVSWAASAAALCAARMGRFAEVPQLAERAAAVEHPGLLRFTVGLAQISTLLMAEQFDQADQVAWQYTDFAELQQPGRAIGEVLVALVRLAGDDPAEAARLLEPAGTTLQRTGYSWGPLALCLHATALAQLGDGLGASKVLARAESRHGTKSALFAPELGLARAWQLAATRDKHGAVDAARRAAGMAERSGQFAVAVLCWRDAARLGDSRAAAALERVATHADCAYTRSALAELRG